MQIPSQKINKTSIKEELCPTLNSPKKVLENDEKDDNDDNDNIDDCCVKNWKVGSIHFFLEGSIFFGRFQF